MTNELITVFGGSGFVGKYVVRVLCKKGYRVRVAVRNPGLAGDQRLSGEVGQVQIVQANVRNRDSIERALEGADGVVNLVAILFEAGKQTFKGTQETGARNIAELAAKAGIKNVVHVSAIGADKDSGAEYSRTKASAEVAVMENCPDAVILRPSLIFGQEDQFFNRFASMTGLSPFLPAIGGGKTKLQPVFVGDVANAVVASLERDDAKGKVFELGGPSVYMFTEIYEFILKQIDKKRFILPLPFFVAKVMGIIFSVFFKILPLDPPLTGDQVELLKADNVVADEGVGTFADLGIAELASIEVIVPEYLWRYRAQGQFHDMKSTES